MPDKIGQQIGNYRLVRLLGSGGFAEVYLGRHVHIHKQAAIKFLHAELSQKYQEGFLQEAETIESLKHLHIIRVLDFGIDSRNQAPYLIMEYAPQGTLRNRHAHGNIVPLQRVVTYVKQIAEALQYAHDRSVIHRDLKPENLLVGESGEIVVSDFGIAAIAHGTASIATEAYAGTVPYSAPEQIKGKPRRESDQYSLGIIVYEWLCGERPFGGDQLQLMYQHINVPPPPLREKVTTIPSAVEAVVLKALAKEPKERFMSVEEFALTLQQTSPLALPTFVKPPVPAVQQPRTTTTSSQPPQPMMRATRFGEQQQPPLIRSPNQLAPSTAEIIMPGGQQSARKGLSRRAVVLGELALAGGSLTLLVLFQLLTVHFAINLIIATLVGLVAEFIVGWRLPFGIIGAIITALLGVWLLTGQVIVVTGIGDAYLNGVPIFRALIGAIILVLIWHLLTYPAWSRRRRFYRQH